MIVLSDGCTYETVYMEIHTRNKKETSTHETNNVSQK